MATVANDEAFVRYAAGPTWVHVRCAAGPTLGVREAFVRCAAGPSLGVRILIDLVGCVQIFDVPYF